MYLESVFLFLEMTGQIDDVIIHYETSSRVSQEIVNRKSVSVLEMGSLWLK